jgi:hypothetical protein
VPGSGQWAVGSAQLWGTGGAANPHLRRGLLGFGRGTVVANPASALIQQRRFGQSEAAKSLDVFRKQAVLGKQIKFYRLLTNEPSFPDARGGLP